MSENSILCLIKFIKEEEYLESFLNGQVYFKPLNEYRDLQDEERGDPDEGVYELENTQLTEIKRDHPTLGAFFLKPAPNSNCKITKFDDGPYLNFSTYAITSKLFQNVNEHLICERMAKLGDAVMINNPSLFLNSVFIALNRQKRDFRADIVSYHDYSRKGKLSLSLFDKSNKFEHQQEFRIILKSSDENPFTLAIESIKDYSTLIRSKEIIEMIWEAKRPATESD